MIPMKRIVMQPLEIITKFDEFLCDKNFHFEAIVIGAGALHIMKVITRATIDIDVLSPDLPERLIKLAAEFRSQMKSRGVDLMENWINNGPKSLIQELPTGWENDTQSIFQGKALQLKTLSRANLLKSKLFAYCDRDERDLSDLKHLNPSKTELHEAISWVKDRDLNPGWPKHVEEKFNQLAKVLGYEF